MLYKDGARKDREKEELEGAKFYWFNDTVTIESTGAYPDMGKKGTEYKKVHRLTANHLVEKGYAKIV